MNATQSRATFAATCTRIESPDVKADRRTLTVSDVVRQDITDDSSYQKHITHNVCEESFTDRAAFVAHMKAAHGVRMAPASQINVKRRAPKAPPVTAYDPRPLDAGAWVEWVQDGVTRTGQVWAAADGKQKGYLWVIPAECRDGETYVELYSRNVKPLGHAVPVGLFGDDDATPAEESARVEPSPDRVFADASAVKAHWTAGGDADAVPRMPVLALTACADMVVNGGLVAVKDSREWTILHAGSGKSLHSAGYGPTTKRATVEAMRLLSLLPVPWGAATADTVEALRAGDDNPARGILGTILSGVAVESDVLAVAARMAPVAPPVVEESAPVVESAQDETPDYGVTVDGVMVAKVRRVSIVEETAPVAPAVEAVAQDDPHAASFEADAKYAHLVQWRCACGESGTGYTRQGLAETLHARHASAATPPATAPPVVIVPPAPVEPPSVAQVTATGPIPAADSAPVLTVTGHAPDTLHCDRCEREHRKGTVTVSDGAGTVRHLGLACAAIVLGLEAAVVKASATEAQRRADATGRVRRRLSVA